MSAVAAVAVILYVLFLLFYVVHSAFLIYHLLRFTVQPAQGRAFAGIFAAISVVLLLLSLGLLGSVRWNLPLLPPAGSAPASRVL